MKIAIGNTGLVIGKSHKGDLDIFLKEGYVFNRNRHISAFPMDCTGELFRCLGLQVDAMHNPEHIYNFLLDYEDCIKKAFMIQKKQCNGIGLGCFVCGLKGNHCIEERLPYGICADWEETDYLEIDSLIGDDIEMMIFAPNGLK